MMHERERHHGVRARPLREGRALEPEPTLRRGWGSMRPDATAVGEARRIGAHAGTFERTGIHVESDRRRGAICQGDRGNSPSLHPRSHTVAGRYCEANVATTDHVRPSKVASAS